MTDTYAKLFPTMYTGSMYGAGLPVFAVWPWILAHKDENGRVEVNPVLVASELGGTAQQVQEAIDYLMRPDPGSRSKEEEGRRLVKVSQFGYRLVNNDYYRQLSGSRREYWRQWRADHKRGATGSTRTGKKTRKRMGKERKDPENKPETSGMPQEEAMAEYGKGVPDDRYREESRAIDDQLRTIQNPVVEPAGQSAGGGGGSGVDGDRPASDSRCPGNSAA